MRQTIILVVLISCGLLFNNFAVAQNKQVPNKQVEYNIIKFGEIQKMGFLDISIKEVGYKNFTLIGQGRAGGGGLGSLNAGGNSWNKSTVNKWGITIGFENRNNTTGKVIIPIKKILVIDSTNKSYSVDEKKTIWALKGKILENAKFQSTGFDQNGPALVAIVEEWFDSKKRLLLRLSQASAYSLIEVYGENARKPYATIKADFNGEWEVQLSENTSFLLTLIFDAEKGTLSKELQWSEMQPFNLSKD